MSLEGGRERGRESGRRKGVLSNGCNIRPRDGLKDILQQASSKVGQKTNATYLNIKAHVCYTSRMLVLPKMSGLTCDTYLLTFIMGNFAKELLCALEGGSGCLEMSTIITIQAGGVI